MGQRQRFLTQLNVFNPYRFEVKYFKIVINLACAIHNKTFNRSWQIITYYFITYWQKHLNLSMYGMVKIFFMSL